jgi:hypothetical protein
MEMPQHDSDFISGEYLPSCRRRLVFLSGAQAIRVRVVRNDYVAAIFIAEAARDI